MSDASSRCATDVFAAWRARVDAGEDLMIEELCREHPEHADELLHLHADWMLAQSLPLSTVPPSPSLSARLRKLFGDGVDPGICLDPRKVNASPLPLGEEMDREVTASRYDVRDKVGQGGMGAVYRVFDQDLRRTLAMKVALDRDPSRLARFLEEAQVNSQLDHPGIVPVHELGIDLQGRVFFTMKLVRGETLDDVFEKVAAGVDGWSVTRAASILLRIAEAMAFAHEKRVIHRDLKPSNVMIGRHGEVYVMDWGLARVLDDPHAPPKSILESNDESFIATGRSDSGAGTDNRSYATRDGDIIGTPAYMSPEQAYGRLEILGPPTDVYSLGAMLYRLLAGKTPYSDGFTPTRGFEVIRKLLVGPPTPLEELAPEAPPELLAICQKAMARDLTARYASMTALGNDLRAYLENRVVAAYESGALAELKKWIRRNRGLAIAAGLALAATTAGLGGIGLVEKKRRVDVETKGAELATRKSEFDQLAGVVRLEDALRSEQDLHPPWPEKIPAIDRWLATNAAPLASLKPRLEATLREIESRGTAVETAPAGSSAQVGSDADRFLHAALSKLLQDLSTFESTTLADVERRAAWAHRIESLTLNHPAASASWQQAHDAIAQADDVVASRRYADAPLDLVPQIGLVPLGMNPVTKLWEFYDLRSACDLAGGIDPATIAIPTHREDGSLAVDDNTGIVFVLVPGGPFVQGAQAIDPKLPNYDPAAEDNESAAGSTVVVTLDAYLISRYEMTQGQWARLAGENPSFWMAQAPSRTSLAGPVENVSADDCRELLERHGMGLPTEAQWECACRGGTSTPFAFGSDSVAMPSYGNVKDQSFATTFADSEPESVDPFDDGNALPCRIGSYAPNRFGLHDVHGNVMEWCRDSMANYTVPCSPGDGERSGSMGSLVIVRGGCYGGKSVFGRAADRQWLPRETRTHDLGCRPVRRVLGSPR